MSQNGLMEINGERQRFLHFVVDETHLRIEGKEHCLLACLGFSAPHEVSAGVVDAKFEIGLRWQYEIKWGKRDLAEDDRRVLTERLFELIGTARCALVVLHEGRDKQSAASDLVSRIIEFCSEKGIGAFSIVFDRNLVRDAKPLWALCSGSELICLGIQEHESEYDQLVQLADLFAGFCGYSIRQTLNDGPSGKMAFWIEGDEDIDGLAFDLPLKDWFFLQAMGLFPRATEESVDGDDTWVEHNAWGSGFLVKSSMSHVAQSALYREVVRTELKGGNGSWIVRLE